jgi:ABC-type sugar transport system ATPase subunit
LIAEHLKGFDSRTPSGPRARAHDIAAEEVKGMERNAGSITVHEVRKEFGSVTALDGANLTIEYGKVTALVGDNGAGKSTMVKVLSGVTLPDGGEIRVCGEPVSFDTPNEARAYGVHTLFQDLALANNLDVVENMFLGTEVKRQVFGITIPLLNRPAMENSTARLLREVGITTIGSLSQRMETMSGGQRQTVAIARAVREQASVVILDEPTAALGVQQSEQVKTTIHHLRAAGTGVLLVSHNLKEVFEVADVIAVMRLGQVVSVFDAKTVEEDEVVASIVGTKTARPETEHGS